MSYVVKDFACPECHAVLEREMIRRGEIPTCKCGADMAWQPAPCYTDTAGGEFYSRAFDRTFAHQKEMKDFAKARGLELGPSADKHHGARNESHRGLGKLYCYPGQKNRSSYSDRYGAD